MVNYETGERSFLGDELVEGGQLGVICNVKDYTEVCNFQQPNFMMRFYFITRCYSSYMETVLLIFVSLRTLISSL